MAATSPSARAAWPTVARSAFSEKVVRTTVAARSTVISAANARAYPRAASFSSGSKTGVPSARETSDGSRNAGRAPGGYSTRKSRYGTSPSVIRSPKDW